MAEPGKGGDYRTEELVAIKEKLRQGRLETQDLQRLEEIVVSVERAAAALRAAVVE